MNALLDNTQAVVAAYLYDPFGVLLAQTGSLTQPFQFSTKRFDPQTGLSYYGYRFYAPEIGRWTTRDPLGEAGGMNLYAFVGNNPVNWVDPWGLAKGGTQHASGPGTSNDSTIQEAKKVFNSGKDRDLARKEAKDILNKEIEKLQDRLQKAKGKGRKSILNRLKQLRAFLKTGFRNKTPLLIVTPINPYTGIPLGTCPIGDPRDPLLTSDPNKPFHPIYNPGGYI